MNKLETKFETVKNRTEKGRDNSLQILQNKLNSSSRECYFGIPGETKIESEENEDEKLVKPVISIIAKKTQKDQ